MGNPVFLDESWWTNDPLTKFPLSTHTPIVILADAALSQLTVIIAKLTVLRQSAASRRQKMFARMGDEGSTADEMRSTRQQLDARIRQQTESLEMELHKWHNSLPSWFSLTASEVEDEVEADVLEIRLANYVHPFIPAVLSCAYAAEIQLWRIANPEAQKPPPQIYRIIVDLINMFPQIPPAADLTIIPGVWIAGLFLRETRHRDRLEKNICKRMEGHDFFLWKFCLHGLIHGWAERRDHRPFMSLPDDAQEIVPGVSENMCRAEGVMNLLGLDMDEKGHREPLYRFKGEASLFSLESDSDEYK
jgi:hypothetical protein